MSSTQMYMLAIRLPAGHELGIDVPKVINQVNSLLGDYAKATKCLYKFKVTGEPRILAIFEVCNVIGLERTVAGLHRMGIFDVQCLPLISYESFAQRLGTADSLTLPSTYSIAQPQLFWLEFNVEFPGKSVEELLATWKREADAVLTGKVVNGLPVDAFKVVAERKVHAFLLAPPEEVDKMSFNLPVMAENGNGVTITCRTVQKLEDYTARIMNESLE